MTDDRQPPSGPHPPAYHQLPDTGRHQPPTATPSVTLSGSTLLPLSLVVLVLGIALGGAVATGMKSAQFDAVLEQQKELDERSEANAAKLLVNGRRWQELDDRWERIDNALDQIQDDIRELRDEDRMRNQSQPRGHR